jgi:hypothetical protein
MDESIIIIMLKDKATGFLDKELGSLDIKEGEDYLVNIYAMDTEEGRRLYVKLSTERDVADWEYSAIYDYYDTECFNTAALSVAECDDDYNPVWEVVCEYSEDMSENETKVAELLVRHKAELDSVYDAIKDKENEYNE